MKFHALTFAIVSILLASPQTLAEGVGPAHEKLDKISNTIVTGKVLKIVATGRTDTSDCGLKTEHVAWLKVIKYLKHTGSTDKELNIQFWSRAPGDDCQEVGDHQHHVGEEGTFYLNCQWVTECTLAAPNGVINND